MPSGDVAATEDVVPPPAITQNTVPFQATEDQGDADGRVRAVHVIPSGLVMQLDVLLAIAQNRLPFQEIDCQLALITNVRTVQFKPSALVAPIPPFDIATIVVPLLHITAEARAGSIAPFKHDHVVPFGVVRT